MRVVEGESAFETTTHSIKWTNIGLVCAFMQVETDYDKVTNMQKVVHMEIGSLLWCSTIMLKNLKVFWRGNHMFSSSMIMDF